MAKQGKAKPEDGEDDAVTTEPGLVALVRGFAEIVASHGLTELIVDTKDTTLTLRRSDHGAAASATSLASHHGGHHAVAPVAFHHAAPLPAAPAPASAAVAVDDKTHVVTSPFVGTFYRKPNPDSSAYVALNDRVDKGAVLCIVEAMKLMNEIEADVAGTVVSILAEDGAPVEYGQALFKIAT
jgi:acetyl-CoA carboxylase biotin carboxyl carrier protein